MKTAQLNRYFLGKNYSKNQGWQSFVWELDQKIIHHPRLSFVGSNFYQFHWQNEDCKGCFREICGSKPKLQELKKELPEWDLYQMVGDNLLGSDLQVEAQVWVTHLNWSQEPGLKFETLGRFQFTKL